MCERSNDWLPLAQSPPGYQAYNPGLRPDPQLNLRPFTLWDDTQSTEPHQPGLRVSFVLIQALFSLHFDSPTVFGSALGFRRALPFWEALF